MCASACVCECVCTCVCAYMCLACILEEEHRSTRGRQARTLGVFISSRSSLRHTWCVDSYLWSPTYSKQWISKPFQIIVKIRNLLKSAILRHIYSPLSLGKYKTTFLRTWSFFVCWLKFLQKEKPPVMQHLNFRIRKCLVLFTTSTFYFRPNSHLGPLRGCTEPLCKLDRGASSSQWLERTVQAVLWGWLIQCPVQPHAAALPTVFCTGLIVVRWSTGHNPHLRHL